LLRKRSGRILVALPQDETQGDESCIFGVLADRNRSYMRLDKIRDGADIAGHLVLDEPAKGTVFLSRIAVGNIVRVLQSARAEHGAQREKYRNMFSRPAHPIVLPWRKDKANTTRLQIFVVISHG